MNYYPGGSCIPPQNKYEFTWRERRGQLQYLRQTVYIMGEPTITTRYFPRPNITIINGEIRNGLVIVDLLTENGGLKYQY